MRRTTLLLVIGRTRPESSLDFFSPNLLEAVAIFERYMILFRRKSIVALLAGERSFAVEKALNSFPLV